MFWPEQHYHRPVSPGCDIRAESGPARPGTADGTAARGSATGCGPPSQASHTGQTTPHPGCRAPGHLCLPC
eukprot:8028812-Alexandrium_andersonii.AAC.1